MIYVVNIQRLVLAIDLSFRNSIFNYVGETTSAVARKPTYTTDRLDDQ